MHQNNHEKGVYYTGLYAGYSLSLGLGTLAQDLFGWKWPYLLSALFGFSIAVLVFMTVQDSAPSSPQQQHPSPPQTSASTADAGFTTAAACRNGGGGAVIGASPFSLHERSEGAKEGVALSSTAEGSVHSRQAAVTVEQGEGMGTATATATADGFAEDVAEKVSRRGKTWEEGCESPSEAAADVEGRPSCGETT